MDQKGAIQVKWIPSDIMRKRKNNYVKEFVNLIAVQMKD